MTCDPSTAEEAGLCAIELHPGLDNVLPIHIHVAGSKSQLTLAVTRIFFDSYMKGIKPK